MTTTADAAAVHVADLHARLALLEERVAHLTKSRDTYRDRLHEAEETVRLLRDALRWSDINNDRLIRRVKELGGATPTLEAVRHA